LGKLILIIMQKLNRLFIFFVSISFISCVEDSALSDQFDDGPNLVGFVSAATNASVVADGSEQNFLLTINLTGPTSMDMSGDISVTVEIDESTTAVEGVHYRLPSKELMLSENTNYIGNLPLTVITDGIAPPLAANPKLILNITEISSDSVVPNGRTYQTVITLEYLCFSILSGKYSTESAAYYRIGTFYYDENDWPEEMEIIYVCDNTYRVLEWVGPFDGNEWYFTAQTNPAGGDVADGATIDYLTEFNGQEVLMNDQRVISCTSEPASFLELECGNTNFVSVDGSDISLDMTFGYFTGGAIDEDAGTGPREFYQLLNKIN